MINSLFVIAGNYEEYSRIRLVNNRIDHAKTYACNKMENKDGDNPAVKEVESFFAKIVGDIPFNKNMNKKYNSSEDLRFSNISNLNHSSIDDQTPRHSSAPRYAETG